jgi:hypothetical protein
MSWFQRITSIMANPALLTKAGRERLMEDFSLVIRCTNKGEFELYFLTLSGHMTKDHEAPFLHLEEERRALAGIADEEYGLGPEVALRFYEAITLFAQNKPSGYALCLERNGQALTIQW